MDYLITTVLWVITAFGGYFIFWNDWKNLNGSHRYFIIVNLGLSILSLVNYLFFR